MNGNDHNIFFLVLWFSDKWSNSHKVPKTRERNSEMSKRNLDLFCSSPIEFVSCADENIKIRARPYRYSDG